MNSSLVDAPHYKSEDLFLQIGLADGDSIGYAKVP